MTPEDTTRQQPCDEVIICPVCKESLYENGADIDCRNGHKFRLHENVFRLFTTADPGTMDGDVTDVVKGFYEDIPFPNYNEFDTLETFINRAKSGVFANMLRQQIPIGANVLDVGCGTAQLGNYLAATCMAKVYAADMSLNSLMIGRKFASDNNIHGIKFVQMNIFKPPIKDDCIDILICNGVLHHTSDPKNGFIRISKLVKKGGYVLVGLYNKLGRIPTDIRRVLANPEISH